MEPPLLLEYVPKLNSSYPSGGVLSISGDGAVFFIPLDDLDQSCNDVRQLSNFSVCSFAVTVQNSHRIGSLSLSSIRPTKLEYCKRFRLLLVIGMLVDQLPGLAVFFLSAGNLEAPPSLVPLFQDVLFPYSDAALCKVTPGMAYLLHSQPSLLHFLAFSPPLSPNSPLLKPIGPLVIAGPATGPLGNVLYLTRISSSSHNNYHFVTWNDECWGEFHMWSLDCLDLGSFNDSSNISSWICHSLFLLPPHTPLPLLVQNKPDLLSKPDPTDELDTNRMYINHISVSDDGSCLAFIVRREPSRLKNSSCLGVCFARFTDIIEATLPCSFHRFNNEKVSFISDLSVYKWDSAFLLGSRPSFGVTMPFSGLCEFFPFGNCLGNFQYPNTEFQSIIHSYCQIGRYRRVFASNSNSLTLLIAIPPSSSFDLTIFEDVLVGMEFDSATADADTRNFRSLAGYNMLSISDLPMRISEKMKKKDLVSGSSAVSRGKSEVLSGIFLKNCKICQVLLLRPLVCSKCLAAVYCSKKCQRKDKANHLKVCKSQ
ncbi:hypothetical protein RCL1_004649 [Eukaryota sp. TZLM3-RCL]